MCLIVLVRSPVRRRGRKRLCRDVYYHHAQDSDNSDTEDRSEGEGPWVGGLNLGQVGRALWSEVTRPQHREHCTWCLINFCNDEMFVKHLLGTSL